jgi:hypothetical protein
MPTALPISPDKSRRPVLSSGDQPAFGRGPAVSVNEQWHADERWLLVERMTQSQGFYRSAFLCGFLRYIVSRELEGRSLEITEQQIGERVFGRAAGYSPGEDNIVRNYARLLRHRIDEYFAGPGAAETLRIQVPRGGYFPVFTSAAAGPEPSPSPEVANPAGDEADEAVAPVPPPISLPSPAGRLGQWLASPTARRASRHPALLVAAAIAVVALAAFGVHRSETSAQRHFWGLIFNSHQDTYLIPADSGLSIYQDLSGHLVSLPDYIAGGYRDPVRGGTPEPTAVRLGARSYTSIGDLQIATSFARLPWVVPGRFHIRSPRDLRLDDLKQGNVILLGAIASDPWVDLFQPRMNFQFVSDPVSHHYFIRNVHPRAGERAVYRTDPGDATHPTYGLISVQRNLNGTGYVVLLEGLNMVGTEAAADTLMSRASRGLLRDTLSAGSGIHPFEALVETSNIDAGSPSSRIVAVRMDPVPSS